MVTDPDRVWKDRNGPNLNDKRGCSMLDLMRKHAGSWMIKVIIFIIAVVFVFWGVGSMRSRKATQVADVNGEIITMEVYQQAYYRLMDNYRRIYGSRIDENLIKMLRPKETALNQIIDHVLTLQEAERLKIQVSDKALAAKIQQVPVFQTNGAFDYQRYKNLLAQNRMTTEQFERDQKEALIIEKLRMAVLNGVSVSEDEVRAWYDWSDAQVSIKYALFSPAKYKDVDPSEEEIASYFKENEDKYLTEPKVKARYLHFGPEGYKDKVQITDEEIAEYYNNNTDEFKAEKSVEARHILFKVEADADEKTIEAKKAKAMEVFEMAKNGKDFAELAKTYSEGPTSEKGGYLGSFKYNTMVKPFADKAFSMQAGEISEPVKTRFGWHIIKVEKIQEAKVRSLTEATASIRSKLTGNKGGQMALEHAETVYDSVYDGDDLADVANTYEVPVQDTDFFAINGLKVKGVAEPRKFAQTAFGLETMAISEIQDYKDGYYLIQVTAKSEAAVPAFETVAKKVKADVIRDRQDQRAKADAEAFLADVQKGAAMEKAGEPYKITPMETGLFGRRGPIPKIGSEPPISQSAFELSTEKPLLDKVVKGKQGWYVIQLKERQLPPEDGFAKMKESIFKRLSSQKKQAAFEGWLADLKTRSQIEINEELLNQ